MTALVSPALSSPRIVHHGLVRVRLSQSTVPLIVRLVLHVCALQPKRMCLLWSSEHLLGCTRQPVQTFLRHRDVHDFLQLAVGVVWCFNFNCEVSSVLPALKWNHSASVYFACKRTIKPETDPVPLPCHEFDSHQRRSHLCRDSIVMSLPSVSWDTSKRRPSSNTTDLPAVECGTPASASQ